MLNEAEAIARAQALARELGWAWVEPTHASLRKPWFGKGPWHWHVVSHYGGGLGTMARVVLDAETGEVLDKGFISR